MNPNSLMNNIIAEYEKKTEWSKQFDSTCATQDKLKIIGIIIEKYSCDFDVARMVCDYFIDGTPLPSDLTPQEIARNNQIAQDWQNKPKCPICSSTNIKKISGLSKAGSVALFGIFAVGKVSKQWHCNNCKSDF